MSQAIGLDMRAVISIDFYAPTFDAVDALGMGLDIGTAQDDFAIAFERDARVSALENNLVPAFEDYSLTIQAGLALDATPVGVQSRTRHEQLLKGTRCRRWLNHAGHDWKRGISVFEDDDDLLTRCDRAF